MSNYEDVIKDMHILFEFPTNLPYIRTSLRYKNKYIIYKYNNRKFIKVYDDDKQCHMIYIGDFWEGSSLQRFLNTTGGEWWSPQNE